MKQTTSILLTVALAGVSVEAFSRQALVERGLFGGDSTTKVSSGPGGAAGHGAKGAKGGRARSGNGGHAGKVSGHKTGAQHNKGGNGGKFNKVSTNMQGASTGMNGGNAGGGNVGSVSNQAGAPLQFYGGMFDKALPSNMKVSSQNSISNIGSGGYAGVSGTNSQRNGGFGDGNGNGGVLGGAQSNSGSQSSRGGRSGNARGGAGGSGGAGGRGGDSSTGGGNSSKGGDGQLAFSPTLSIPPPIKRSLDRRALELEEEYAWVMQQKRDIEDQEALVARFAISEDEQQNLGARSEDPEAEMFYAREADAAFDDEDDFQGLSARDILDAYLALTSDI